MMYKEVCTTRVWSVFAADTERLCRESSLPSKQEHKGYRQQSYPHNGKAVDYNLHSPLWYTFLGDRSAPYVEYQLVPSFVIQRHDADTTSHRLVKRSRM